MKFRKKPVVIEATQWFKNGDHPKDACKMVHPLPDSTTQFAPFLSEGKVVRYYRTPDLDGSRVCEQCENVMHDHGWIDTLERGHVVCPGDWIITGVKGERYPCKPDIFAATYEPVSDDAPVAPQAEPCIGNDSACPCQDGDACHYKDAADGTKAWPVPQAEPKREPSCLWSRADDDTDVWETKCGHAFTIIDGTPTDNQMAFCCYCGRRVDEEIGGSDE